jgi:hypothetical protein
VLKDLFKTEPVVRGAIKLPALIIALLSSIATMSNEFRVSGLEFRVNEPDTSRPKHQTLNPKPETANAKRLWIVGGAHAAFWAGSYIALDKAWYADYPRAPFHFFNDNREWNQMDKAGHLWTTYTVSRVSGGLWRWTGLSRSSSAWLGGISGIAYQSIIEIQDGFSSEWGFSPVDMVCNVAGAALFVGQELGWKEQRFSLKLSYWPYDYDGPELRARRDQLFGNSTAERLLKEYNSQTIWLSANLHSFLPKSGLPKWLNIAVGYSSDGLLGGRENKWTNEEGIEIDRRDIPRVRQFFISPDIDLTRIRTRSKFLRTVFSLVNCLKIPAPALELNSKGKFKAHAIYY